MTTRDIRAHLREMYDMDVSPDLISPVTYGVLEELTEWQAPPASCSAHTWASESLRQDSHRSCNKAVLVPVSTYTRGSRYRWRTEGR
jgi:hypothetical protein